MCDRTHQAGGSPSAGIRASKRPYVIGPPRGCITHCKACRQMYGVVVHLSAYPVRGRHDDWFGREFSWPS